MSLLETLGIAAATLPLALGSALIIGVAACLLKMVGHGQ